MIIQQSESAGDPLRTFDLSTAESPTAAVVTAISEQADADPTAIEPLHTVIDTDALNALFRQTASAPSRARGVQFEYLGYSVVLNDQTGYLYEQSRSSTAESP